MNNIADFTLSQLRGSVMFHREQGTVPSQALRDELDRRERLHDTAMEWLRGARDEERSDYKQECPRCHGGRMMTQAISRETDSPLWWCGWCGCTMGR